ncbi:MAG: helicase-associated domain-containing protein [bacterium]|nr:helicase-associated domain-containing protein [bacterium]
MHLIEYLSVAPIEYLQLVSSHIGATAKFNSKSDLIRQISSRLRNPEILQELIAGLELESRLALRLIIYLGGIAGLPVQQCHQKLLQLYPHRKQDAVDREVAKNQNLLDDEMLSPQKKPLEESSLIRPEQIMARLRSLGIVYTSSAKSAHIPRYIVPQDIRNLLIPLLSADIQRYYQFQPKVQVPHPISPWAILHDTFSFLSYLRRTPPQLSQDKQLHKKTILEINHLFEVKDKSTFPKGEYPTRLRLIIYFCRSAQLIFEDISFWRVNESAVLTWFNLSKLEQCKSIEHFWSRNQVSTLPELSVFRTILAGLPVNAWVKFDSLIAAANAIMPAAEWKKSYPAEITRFLLPGLAHLGLIQLGESKPDKEPVVALTEFGKLILAGEGKLALAESKSVLLVQPNFELFISAECSLLTRWELELFADPVNVDLMVTLRLSKRSSHRAFEAGYTAKRIIRLMQSLSQKPIPQNVMVTLEEWEKQYGRIYFAELFLLRCDNESLAKELQSSPKIKPFILGTVSPKDLIVNKKQYPKLVQILKEEGYLPKVKLG